MLRKTTAAALAALLVLLAPAVPRADDDKMPPGQVLIGGEIDGGAASEVEDAVKAAKAAKLDHLDVVLDSRGGAIDAGLRIIRVLRASGLRTTCRVEGLALSMAAYILESPACGERVVRPYSVVMFHEGHVTETAGMTEQGAANVRAELGACNAALMRQAAERMGVDPVEFQRVLRGGAELWLAGEDVVAAGAADRIER